MSRVWIWVLVNSTSLAYQATHPDRISIEEVAAAAYFSALVLLLHRLYELINEWSAR